MANEAADGMQASPAPLVDTARGLWHAARRDRQQAGRCTNGRRMNHREIEDILAAMDEADQQQVDVAAFEPRALRRDGAFTLCVLVGCLVVFTYAAVRRWEARRTNRWSPFWDAIGWVWGASALLVSVSAVFSTPALRVGQVQVLRREI